MALRPVSQAGVKMYEYGDGFLHQKVMLADDQVAAIGTANFDNRSFRLNFEITVLTIDQEFASDVERMLEQDFARSTEIKPDALANSPWWYRVGARVARLFAPVL